MKTLDLNTVVNNAKTTLYHLLGQDIHLAFLTSSSLHPVYADEGLLHQVLISLAVHAGRHLPAGGRITLETKNVALEGGTASAAPAGEYAMLAIRDNGAGLSADDLERLFQPGANAPLPANDQILDLARIPGILQSFGGYIQAASEMGHGTTFTLLLPRHEEAREVGAPATAAPGARTGIETVLLVEDEDSVRSLIRTLLQSDGYDVLEAIHGDEALQLAQSHPHPIDLLITDLVLPRMSGKVLIDRLLAVQPRMKVLVISGYPNDRVAQLGSTGADFAFLQKPFRCDVLANLVRQLLDAPERQTKTP